MTEGWLWSGQYPECARVTEIGNHQSMELDKNFTRGSWAKDNNLTPQFFIINETIMSKLCILGEETEPCFEGSSIEAPKYEFSFNEEFKTQLFSMMNEIKEILGKGGAVMNEDITKVEEPVVEEPVVEPTEPVVEEPAAAPQSPEEPTVEEPVVEEPVVEEPAVEEPVVEEPAAEPVVEPAPVVEAPAAYNLEDVVEYQDLLTKFNELQNNYNNIVAQNEQLTNENQALSSFKFEIEKERKQAMIKSFYMLSDEDKKDVIDNIDSYSIEEIEAKLSVICVRSKVNFNLEDDKGTQEPNASFSLNSLEDDDSSIPAWIKAMDRVANI